MKRERKESFEKMNNVEECESDKTITETRDFERLNVNLRSARGVKLWP